jgi:hypothetical protein
MRKSAVSIASNLAEGTRHRTAGYHARVIIALGEHAGASSAGVVAIRNMIPFTRPAAGPVERSLAATRSPFAESDGGGVWRARR